MKDVKSKNIVVDHEALNIFDDLTTLLIFPKTKTPVEFEPFQYFIIVNIIGLFYKTGERKYTRSYLQLARKNGKTALMAVLALFDLLHGKNGESEICFVATGLAQAGIGFNFVKTFSRQVDPKHKYLFPTATAIKFDADSGIIECLPSNSNRLDGKNQSYAIIDEYHAHINSSLLDVCVSSMASRSYPHVSLITTAGLSLFCPCYEMRNEGIQVLNDEIKDERTFYAIFEHDSPDEWKDEKMWIKSNPNLGTTVKHDFLDTARNKALRGGDEKNATLTKSFNYWVASSTEWIPYPDLKAVMRKIDWANEFSGNKKLLYAGIDLASVSDMTALAWLIERDNVYYYGVKYYLPEKALQTSINAPFYRKWADEKYLTLTPGNITDYDYVRNDLESLGLFSRIADTGYDPYNSSDFIADVSRSIRTTPVSQGTGNLNKATRSLERQVLGKTCVIDYNPITAWMFDNVELVYDTFGNCRISKSNKASEKKIDGIAAMINALTIYQKNQ